MAHLHYKRTVYRSGGGTASKRLEYITRQPERDLAGGRPPVALYPGGPGRPDL